MLVEAVGHDDTGCRVDLAEDAAAVGVVNVQTVVADAQPRAEDLKAVAAAEGDDAQRVERRRVKARERIIGLHELLGQILARAQLVKQRLPVGRGVPFGLGQLAEADAPARILRLERDDVVAVHEGIKCLGVGLRQIQPAAADKLREVLQKRHLALEIRLGDAVVRAHEQRRLHVGQVLLLLRSRQSVEAEDHVFGHGHAFFRVAAAHPEVVVKELVLRKALRKRAHAADVSAPALAQHGIGTEIFDEFILCENVVHRFHLRSRGAADICPLRQIE